MIIKFNLSLKSYHRPQTTVYMHFIQSAGPSVL